MRNYRNHGLLRMNCMAYLRKLKKMLATPRSQFILYVSVLFYCILLLRCHLNYSGVGHPSFVVAQSVPPPPPLSPPLPLLSGGFGVPHSELGSHVGGGGVLHDGVLGSHVGGLLFGGGLWSVLHILR